MVKIDRVLHRIDKVTIQGMWIDKVTIQGLWSHSCKCDIDLIALKGRKTRK
jgi:hypothetical protein